MLEIANAELAGLRIESELQLAPAQHLAVIVGQHRHQNLARKRGQRRRPVDVEVSGVLRGAAVLEHIEPPGVVAAHDAHVIGHDVGHLPHTVGGKRRSERGEVIVAAKLRIELAMIDDVVAVRASRPRLEPG